MLSISNDGVRDSLRNVGNSFGVTASYRSMHFIPAKASDIVVCFQPMFFFLARRALPVITVSTRQVPSILQDGSAPQQVYSYCEGCITLRNTGWARLCPSFIIPNRTQCFGNSYRFRLHMKGQKDPTSLGLSVGSSAQFHPMTGKDPIFESLCSFRLVGNCLCA
jgi:hypothetical protein